MNKILKITYASVLVVILSIPAFAGNYEGNAVSEINNSYLPDELTENEAEYTQERVGFHDEAVTAYQNFNYNVFNDFEHPSYLEGENGYQFFKLEEPDIDYDFLDAFARYLRRVQDYCESRGVPFLYCINPSKINVYYEFLPEGYVYDGDAFYDVFTSYLEKNGVNWIGNLELLREKAKTEQVFNVKFDPGHWNDRGEFYGTNHMLEALSEYLPEVEPWDPDDFIVTEQLEQYQALSYFEINEKVPYYSLSPDKSESIKVEDLTEKYDSIELNEQHRTFAVFKRVDDDASHLPRVLIFHGSYYNRNKMFYSHAFKESYDVHNYENVLNFEYYFNIFQPDCVIITTAEYATSRNYFNYDSLCSKTLNPVFSTVSAEPHDEFRLEEVSADITTQDSLTKIDFNTAEEYSFGYLEMNGNYFDLIIDGDSVSCTIDTGNFVLENAELYLFR
ncbi:MAG: alginate O-acetyltransferase AlgX-related protein [Eubacterium sp.]|jgi:hypothetical protein